MQINFETPYTKTRTLLLKRASSKIIFLYMLITKTYNNGVTKNYKKITDLAYLLIILLFRTRHRGSSIGKAVPKNFANFTGKHLC